MSGVSSNGCHRNSSQEYHLTMRFCCCFTWYCRIKRAYLSTDHAYVIMSGGHRYNPHTSGAVFVIYPAVLLYRWTRHRIDCQWRPAHCSYNIIADTQVDGGYKPSMSQHLHWQLLPPAASDNIERQRTISPDAAMICCQLIAAVMQGNIIMSHCVTAVVVLLMRIMHGVHGSAFI